MDQVGYLSIVGRIKDMIIRGGENTYPRAPRAGRGQAPRPAAVGRAARAGRRPRASSSSTSRAAASPRAARSRGGDRTPAARPEASRRRARWRAGLRLPGRARRTAASPATRRPGRPALALDERMVDPQRAAAGRAEFVDRTRLRSQPARRPQAAACVELGDRRAGQAARGRSRVVAHEDGLAEHPQPEHIELLLARDAVGARIELVARRSVGAVAELRVAEVARARYHRMPCELGDRLETRWSPPARRGREGCRRPAARSSSLPPAPRRTACARAAVAAARAASIRACGSTMPSTCQRSASRIRCKSDAAVGDALAHGEARLCSDLLGSRFVPADVRRGVGRVPGCHENERGGIPGGEPV